MLAVRYRTGIDGTTGLVLRGQAHLAQSLATIWGTRLDSRVMRLAFGATLRSHLSEDVDPALALAIYDDLTSAVYAWEPEYRIDAMQLVTVTRLGVLGLKHGGRYYPEGRYGNYAIVEQFGGVAALARYEQAASRLQ